MENGYEEFMVGLRDLLREFYSIGEPVLKYSGNDVQQFVDLAAVALQELREGDLIEYAEYQELAAELAGLPLLDSTLMLWRSFNARLKGGNEPIDPDAVFDDEDDDMDIDDDDMPEEGEVTD